MRQQIQRAEVDFTSALYLGMRHGSHELLPWNQFSTGRPAALKPSQEASWVAQELARLQKCEAGIVGPSTFHLFWDLFTVLAKREKRIALYVDRGLYPIGWWGIERIRAQGIPVFPFREHDPSALGWLLGRTLPPRSRPVVVTDGLRPGRWGPAPLRKYVNHVRARTGYLVIDDTQALGILGSDPTPRQPYGFGGGGSLPWHDIEGPDIVTVSSLAKGFGVPMAILGGSSHMIRRFETHSETLVHCSPPSVAVLHAALHALRFNQTEGETRRHRLWERVKHFREQLRDVGLFTTGGPFPVQSLADISGYAARTLYQQLLEQGIRSVLHRGAGPKGPRLSFLITARHRLAELDHAVDILARQAQAVNPNLGEVAL